MEERRDVNLFEASLLPQMVGSKTGSCPNVIAFQIGAGQQLRSSKLQCSAAALTKHSRQPVLGRSVCFGGPSGQGPGRGTAKSAAARQCSRYRGLRSRDRIRVMELVSKTAVGVRDEAQAELPCPVLQVTATEGSSKR